MRAFWFPKAHALEQHQSNIKAPSHVAGHSTSRVLDASIRGSPSSRARARANTHTHTHLYHTDVCWVYLRARVRAHAARVLQTMPHIRSRAWTLAPGVLRRPNSLLLNRPLCVQDSEALSALRERASRERRKRKEGRGGREGGREGGRGTMAQRERAQALWRAGRLDCGGH